MTERCGEAIGKVVIAAAASAARGARWASGWPFGRRALLDGLPREVDATATSSAASVSVRRSSDASARGSLAAAGRAGGRSITTGAI